MNPISTTNFKYAIGNLPIKVSRDDDMLFSFRNQVMTNRSIKDNESNQLPEYITSRHGEIAYLLTNMEDNICQFMRDFKMCIDEVDNDYGDDSNSNINYSSELRIRDESSIEENVNEEENSLVTLLDIGSVEDKHILNDVDNVYDDFIDEDQFNEQAKDEHPSNASNNMSKAKSIEPKKSICMNKNNESSMYFKTVDPLKIANSSTTPKAKISSIKPQISILKSAKSTRATMHSSKKSTKSKTADRKIRKMLNNEGCKTGGRRAGRISKKSMDRVASNPNDTNPGKFLITSPDNSNSGRGVIKFFSLKNKEASRNCKAKGKITSVSTNRPYVKKSNILHTSKGSSSGRLDVSSKSQNNRNGRQIENAAGN